MQRMLIQIKVHYKNFSLCSYWNDSQTFKSSSSKKLSSRVCVMAIDKICFDECFFISFNNWNALFSIKVCCYFEIFQPPLVAFFETNFLKEVRTIRYLLSTCSALIPKFPKNLSYFLLDKSSPIMLWLCFLHSFIFFYCLFYFPHFSL